MRTQRESIYLTVLLICCLGCRTLSAQDDSPRRTDFLTFANGAIPVGIGGEGAADGPNYEHAVRIIDGDPTPFAYISTLNLEASTEFTYALPALTTFDRFAVPNVLEVPSPSQTYTRHVEILGSATGPNEGFQSLASAPLEIHGSRGEVTEIPIANTVPVRWLRVRLESGIELLRERMSFDFSEIIGNGTQETRERADHFNGRWSGRGVRLSLRQEGPLVSGCVDRQNALEGSVDGNILKARSEDAAGIPSLFILSVLDDGTVRGVRSNNGGPFRLYTGPSTEDDLGQNCGVEGPPALGCGSVIHGITFDFDSANLRDESALVLAELFKGLDADPASTILIEGHTSSEGTEAYNLDLSERRAQVVVEDLVSRGIDPGRLSAVGVGEVRPIASNTDESGRSLNRRVEVNCR